MKLLLDENLSPSLSRRVEDLFPGTIDVCSALGEMPTDTQIWSFARDYLFTIVSKDNDFRQRSFVLGAPPKVVWLSVGNSGTAVIERLLRDRYQDLLAFDADPDATLLVLLKTA
ncbi:MAG TPA: DUF5615 family PIN-like protein [Tepidisphaeraceae bacterium]|nr:DUF5615 family PIN-like protein [Tepidisphaeraceae bacterium]